MSLNEHDGCLALPWDVITQILHLLPVKSLLRFRSVSKQFCLEINSPEFIQHYNAHSLQRKNNLSLVMIGGKHNKECLAFMSSSIYECTNLQCEDPATISFPGKVQPRHVQILGSCNGLLCLTDIGHKEFVLLNTSTRRQYVLPSLEQRWVSFRGRAAFGYDPWSDDYKIAKIFDRKHGFKCCLPKVMVYSLNANAWKNVEEKFPYSYVSPWDDYIIVSGRLYFVAHPDITKTSKVLVSFVIDEEKYEEVPVPYSVFASNSIRLGALGDNLCVLVNRTVNDVLHTAIWVMKEYRVQDSWTKQVEIHRGVQDGTYLIFHSNYFVRGDEALLRFINQDLIWSNLNTESERNVKVENIPESFYPFDAAVVVDSLVSLPNQGEKKDKATDLSLLKSFCSLFLSCL